MLASIHYPWMWCFIGIIALVVLGWIYIILTTEEEPDDDPWGTNQIYGQSLRDESKEDD